MRSVQRREALACPPPIHKNGPESCRDGPYGSEETKESHLAEDQRDRNQQNAGQESDSYRESVMKSDRRRRRSRGKRRRRCWRRFGLHGDNVALRLSAPMAKQCVFRKNCAACATFAHDSSVPRDRMLVMADASRYSDSVKRVLLFAATTGYQVREFAGAAARAGIDLVLATDRCHVLENPWGDGAVPMQFEDLVAARGPFDGIVAVGDRPALAAAEAAGKLGLPFHPAGAVIAARSKFESRERFRSAGLLTPEYRLNEPPLRYPCVLKPLGLSASRGVIRANDEQEYVAARRRIQKILEHEEQQGILAEDFIPGREFALEGVVTRGKLHVLALFDKPDPLDGPFFEETIYTTPSRESRQIQAKIVDTTQQAIASLGLNHGPIHAEMRVNDQGVWMLEVAARPIGGLCSRVLLFQNGARLEEILLLHALGGDVSRLRPAGGSHGVMMIPIPEGGVFRGVEGIEEARAVNGIEDVVITVKQGQELLPLPEGASYLGFIFHRSENGPEVVERALREAHSKMRFLVSPALPVVR